MRISVMVGSRCSLRKYAWQNARSSRSMARPYILYKGGNFLAVQRIEALQRFDGFGRVVLLAQRLLFGKVGLAALHGVDEVAADAVQLLGRGRAGEKIHARRAHGGPLALTDQLDALLAARRTRVELPRQVFDGDHRVRALGQAVVGHVHGGSEKTTGMQRSNSACSMPSTS